MPLIPALAALLTGFAFIIGATVLFGMNQATGAWLRALFKGLTRRKPGENVFLDSALAPAHAIAKAFSWVWHKVRADIAGALALQLHPLAVWLGALGTLWHLITMSAAEVAEDTAYAFERLYNIRLPRIARDLFRLGGLIVGVGVLLRHEIHRLWRGIDHLHRDLRGELHRLFRGIDHLVRHHVLPRLAHLEREIARVLERALPGIRRDIRELLHRLRRAERLLTYAALAAVVLKVIARRWPWLFCRNVRRVGLRICGMHLGLLDWLLGVGAAMFVFAELCRFIDALASIAARVLPKLIGPLAVTAAALCNGEKTAAAPLSLATTELPNVPNPLPLA